MRPGPRSRHCGARAGGRRRIQWELRHCQPHWAGIPAMIRVTYPGRPGAERATCWHWAFSSSGNHDPRNHGIAKLPYQLGTMPACTVTGPSRPGPLGIIIGSLGRARTRARPTGPGLAGTDSVGIDSGRQRHGVTVCHRRSGSVSSNLNYRPELEPRSGARTAAHGTVNETNLKSARLKRYSGSAAT